MSPRQIRETIEVFFSNGLNPIAFKQAFQRIQEQYDGTISLKSFEQKDEDFVVLGFQCPPNLDRATIHRNIKQNYYSSLDSLEYSLNRLGLPPLSFLPIESSHSFFFTDNLPSQSISIPHRFDNSPQSQAVRKNQDSVAILRFVGNFQHGFPAIYLEIWKQGLLKRKDLLCNLPGNPNLIQTYMSWQQIYNTLAKNTRTLEAYNFEENSNFSVSEQAKEFKKNLNQWLSTGELSSVEQVLNRTFDISDEFRVVIESHEQQVQQLPWLVWNFFDYYEKAEVAISLPNNQKIEKNISRNRVRILLIIGNDDKINIEADKNYLYENFGDAQIVFLVKPTVREFHETLWDREGFDILFFSGHSHSEVHDRIVTGTIKLNNTEEINLKDYKTAFKKAVEKGLQLAIFNSCDGIGLARDLANVNIPQTIVMRESIPDDIAQAFLKQFLANFVRGNSVYLSVRQARNYLQGFEPQDIRYICASWLPVIFQNTTEDIISWEKLKNFRKNQNI